MAKNHFSTINNRKKIKPKSKILLFKNVFSPSQESGNPGLSLATLYLASGFKKAGFDVVLSSSQISGKTNLISNKEELIKILRANPEINFIGLSLQESFFERIRPLIKFLRENSKTFIGVGGTLPTSNPNHVLAHLPEIDFLIRGNGEKVFPRLAEILDGKNNSSSLNEKEKREIANLTGLIFKKDGILISSKSDQINHISQMEDLIDFSFVGKEDLNDGLFLFTSSGCFNNCLFCSSSYKGKFVSVGLKNLTGIIKKYYSHLKKIYNGNIPNSALRLAFLDDDFLADPRLAINFFNFLKKTPFKINFIQTGINAFHIKTRKGYTNKINQSLLNALSPELFDPNKSVNLYLGLENLSDNELKRLGKGYDSRKAEKIIELLAFRKIRVAYHFIASNQLTTLDNIFDNLIKFSKFQINHQNYFQILTPIIPYLVSFYSSPNYKIILSNKRGKFLNIKKVLKIRGKPEYDYPMVENDIPVNKEVREFIPILSDLFLTEKNYLAILDQSLTALLVLREKLAKDSESSSRISAIIKKYENYSKLILGKTGFKILNDRPNMQLMLTRRCQLRCRYCPVVKKNQDMNEKILYKAINLLFTSARKDLRLDFTGGEPLLRFDLIKKGVEYAKELARKKNKNISFYMVSNLIALTDEIADFLKKENFLLELSIDGEERFHNLYKIGKNSRINPYQLTIAQSKKILPKKINNYVVMVVSPLTVGRLERNFYHLLKLGFRKIGINYALGLFWQIRERKSFFRQLDLIKKRFYPFLSKNMIKLGNLESRNEPAILNSEIMVNTDGRVYFLTDWLFERKLKKTIPPLGQVSSIKNINGIFLSRFRALRRLFTYYPSSEIKNIVLDNIDMGNETKSYFSKWT